ncbi:hypothetical protein QAD02_006995 [Eretmocerus hayati]|uniref:Uncharacterized protein n=1 Tax=Eretmocerus hayati TaxID=131215 RepID=A0ACC2N2G4_9HYME|nr:hypothetical protein QAD02_006995 [Eretmocerus hayati]
MSRPAVDRKEQYCLYNSLAILLKAVEGERTTVDLRNEASVNGIVEQADGFMNILMKDCIFTDPRGDRFKYEIFFVQTRNIRYVHIPTHVSINFLIANVSGKNPLGSNNFKMLSCKFILRSSSPTLWVPNG